MGNCNVIVLFLISVIVIEVGSEVGVGDADGEAVGCSVDDGSVVGEIVEVGVGLMVPCGVEVGVIVGFGEVESESDRQ